MASTPPRTCNSCGRQRPIELEMTVKAGPVLTLLSCTTCEHRTWLVDGQAAGVGDVLAAAAGDEDFLLSPSRRISRKRATGTQPASRPF